MRGLRLMPLSPWQAWQALTSTGTEGWAGIAAGCWARAPAQRPAPSAAIAAPREIRAAFIVRPPHRTSPPGPGISATEAAGNRRQDSPPCKGGHGGGCERSEPLLTAFKSAWWRYPPLAAPFQGGGFRRFQPEPAGHQAQ